LPWCSARRARRWLAWQPPQQRPRPRRWRSHSRAPGATTLLYRLALAGSDGAPAAGGDFSTQFRAALDKISDTPKGEEITSILTHLTDTSQNNQFSDKYFSEVNFDLSKCLFIFSYNDESKVNPILKDRMYRIQTNGYESKEKIIIARKHILPKIREQINFKEGDIVIPDETLQYIITQKQFCKDEQGVRNLKRCLEIIHTKLNLFRLVNKDEKLFEKDIAIDVSFPFTVEKKHVDILIKTDDPLNQSMLSMYM
jgi:ATP-dependent Lon protease